MRSHDDNLLALVNDTIPAYISYIDSDLRYVYINRTYQEAFGRTASEIEGHLVSEVLGPSFENVRPHLEAALRGETRRFETRMGTLKDERILSVSHLPRYDADGNICGVTVYGVDITDSKRTETALLQSEKLAAVGRLASSIAHEINNPLEAVTNLIYLSRQEAIKPSVQKYLEMAEQELKRVSVITSQTLRFHRQASKPRAITAEDLFDTVLGIYEGRLRNSNIAVEIAHRATQPVVCFEGDIRQILNNLVGNAIDAMPNGGRLLIRSHDDDLRDGRRLVLTVADTGVGVKDISRIFEAFYTTKGIGGTGLGLWVSKEIANRHGASLNVRSSQLQGRGGTVFRLSIPDASTGSGTHVVAK